MCVCVCMLPRSQALGKEGLVSTVSACMCRLYSKSVVKCSVNYQSEALAMICMHRIKHRAHVRAPKRLASSLDSRAALKSKETRKKNTD